MCPAVPTMMLLDSVGMERRTGAKRRAACDATGEQKEGSNAGAVRTELFFVDVSQSTHRSPLRPSRLATPRWFEDRGYADGGAVVISSATRLVRGGDSYFAAAISSTMACAAARGSAAARIGRPTTRKSAPARIASVGVAVRAWSSLFGTGALSVGPKPGVPVRKW